MLVKEDTSPENRIYRAILSQELETLVKYYIYYLMDIWIICGTVDSEANGQAAGQMACGSNPKSPGFFFFDFVWNNVFHLIPLE